MNAPVNDQLALRAAVSTDKRDGYLSNGDSDADNVSVRLKALYRPNDSVRLLAAAAYTKEDGSPEGSVAAPLSSHDDPWEDTYLNGVHDAESWSLYGQLDVNTPVGVLTVQPARVDSKRLDNRQLLGNVTSFDYAETQDSLEARLASLDTSPIKWVAGLYHLVSDQVRDQGANMIGGTLQSAARVASRTETSAAFVQATAPISDRFRLTLGARVTREEKQQTYAANPQFSRTSDAFT